MKTARFKKRTRRFWIDIRNLLNDIRIKRYAKANNVHAGTKQILKGGVWIDKENNLYNCMGNRIGKIQWEESY